MLRRDEHRGAGAAFGGWWLCQGHWDESWHCHTTSDPPWGLDGAWHGHQPTGAAGHPTKQHLLVESLVLNPTLPEVFAGFWCRGEVGENNFLLLKETDRELWGEQGVVLMPQTRNGVDRAGGWHWHSRSCSGAVWDSGITLGQLLARGMGRCAPVPTPPTLLPAFGNSQKHRGVLKIPAAGSCRSQLQPEVFWLTLGDGGNEEAPWE